MSLTCLWKPVVVLDAALEHDLLQEFVKLGASGYTTVECKGLGRKDVPRTIWKSFSATRGSSWRAITM